MEVFVTYTELTPSTESLNLDISKDFLWAQFDKRYKLYSLKELQEHLEPILNEAIRENVIENKSGSNRRLDFQSIKIVNLRQIMINCKDFLAGQKECCKPYSTNADFKFCPKCGNLL